MKPFQPSAGIIAGINFKLLGAVISGALSYALWPDAPQNWPFRLVSLFMGAMTFSLILQAIKSAVKLYIRDRTIAAYLAQGARPKTAQMASGDALQKAGMLDV